MDVDRGGGWLRSLVSSGCCGDDFSFSVYFAISVVSIKIFCRRKSGRWVNVYTTHGELHAHQQTLNQQGDMLYVELRRSGHR